MDALVAAVQMIGTSIVRVHQHGACITRNKRQAMGRSRGGLARVLSRDLLRCEHAIFAAGAVCSRRNGRMHPRPSERGSPYGATNT